MDTRRFVRVLVALAAVSVLTQAGVEAQTAPADSSPQVRLRWEDFASGPDGAKRLASLQKAVEKMKSLDSSDPSSADYRRSWQYWANIHGYYGTVSPDGTVAEQVQYLKKHGMSQYVPYYEGIEDQTPPDDVAKTVWATCQHSGLTQAVNFFGWHRMYLYYFERVLRWASGDDTLRLPYWDYTDPAQLALPEAYRKVASGLYDAKRNPGMNDGSLKLNSESTDVDDTLKITDYFRFEKSIEGHIHGYVHCTVGPTCPVAHMGDVPVAGGDPVFYSHHANIDRLWACWQQLYGTPAGDWQGQEFSFVDETGTMQTRPVKDFLDSAALGYVYDNVTDCSRPTVAAAAPPAPAAAPRGEREKAMLGSVKAVPIQSPTTHIELDIPRPQLEGALRDLTQPESVRLTLRDITADGHPGTLFHVYLAKKGDPEQRKHVGTLSWFGAFRHRHGGDHGPAAETRSFDVTDELRELNGGSLAAAGLTVILEATDGRVPVNEERHPEHRERVRNAFRAESNLRIGAVELHAVPAPPQREEK
jgi:hypothetical protein